MATAGFPSIVFNGNEGGARSGHNQVAQPFAMPSSGNITSLSVYCGADSAGDTAGYICLWHSNSGALSGAYALVEQVAFTFPVKPGGTNNQAWNTVALPTPVDAILGDFYAVGFWSPVGAAYNFSVDNTGTNGHGEEGSYASPAAFVNAAGFGWNIGAYLTYTPGLSGIKVYNGSANVKRPVRTWNGSAWVWNPVKTWNGSVWQTH